MNHQEPLPVTLIGGYLGSGKTTLVNHLLRHADGLKLAVLVNEFGELPIDADLIEAQDDDLISIAGGCICCSYGDDMLEGIQRLRDLPIRPDHLIIEASGVAMPGAIAAAMSLVRGVTLHTVVVITDAETLFERSTDKYMGDTITRQLISADLLILNRCDLANPAQIQQAKSVLHEHAPNITIIESDFADVPISALLDAERVGEKRLPHTVDIPHAQFTSTFVHFHEPVDVQLLGRCLINDLPGVVRAKGFILDKENGVVCLFQLSGKRVRIQDVNVGFGPGLSTPGISRKEPVLQPTLGIVVIGVLPLFDAGECSSFLQRLSPG